MQELVLRTPDDLNGLAYPYMVGGSDDPCLGKAPFVATKNLHFPNKAEISAIEYYLEHFVWGGLQRTDKENPHPFGIYGVDNWYVNRNSEIGFISGGMVKNICGALSITLILSCFISPCIISQGTTLSGSTT